MGGRSSGVLFSSSRMVWSICGLSIPSALSSSLLLLILSLSFATVTFVALDSSELIGTIAKRLASLPQVRMISSHVTVV